MVGNREREGLNLQRRPLALLTLVPARSRQTHRQTHMAASDAECRRQTQEADDIFLTCGRILRLRRETSLVYRYQVGYFCITPHPGEGGGMKST